MEWVLLGESVARHPARRTVPDPAENEAATLALLRATAGIEVSGAGRLVRPGARNLRLLPERPYLPPGTLREALVAADMETPGARPNGFSSCSRSGG